MKTLKVAIAAFILAFTAQAASAQVSIGVSIGTPPPRRVVVVHEPVYREVVYERPVVYERSEYRRVMVAPAYPRRAYYSRNYYQRPIVFHRDYHGRGHYGRR